MASWHDLSLRSVDDGRDDKYFPRSELPAEAVHATRELLVDARVEFEVKGMPDEILRAQRLLFDQTGPPPIEDSPSQCFGQIRNFDRKKGYGYIVMTNSDDLDVWFMGSSFPEDSRDSSTCSVSRPAGAEVHVDEIVRFQFDKGFGFLVGDKLDEDILARKALPKAFQFKGSKKDTQMPSLNGVEVNFELESSPSGENGRGPRAEKVTLLLNYHAENRCGTGML